METINWKSTKYEKPTLNVPFIARINDDVVLGWRRALDGKYEIRYYYADYVMPSDSVFDWVSTTDKAFK